MTIGQIVECFFGKVCTSYGAYGDCTAFQVKGPNYQTYGPLLVKAGFHSSGNQVLYNGMSGDQLSADIFIGPTYYMRLKHMVKDKINYRARGPNTVLTRQPVQGRANDGGLRIGEMERDGILAHGMSYFLNESFMVRGEKTDYYIAVCNKTGAISIYNQSRNLFLSPYADGPINFHMNPDGTQSILNVSRFGRSFSILRVPYSFKLMIQELQVMNVQMRIITDDNVDQLLSMSFSENINKLMMSDKPVPELIKQINDNINKQLRQDVRVDEVIETPVLPEPVKIESDDINPTPNSPAYNPNESPLFSPNSPAYNPNESPPYAPNSPAYMPSQSPPYAPNSPAYNPYESDSESNINKSKKSFIINPNILEVEKPNEKEEDEKGNDESSKSEDKKIIIQKTESSESPSSSETRKITL
jgi:DNA-directed RNA polymerase II subunit RPB2